MIEKDEYLQRHKDDRLENDSYLTRFLRAGGWSPEKSLEVLKAYSSLGKEYTSYVSRAIPTK